MVHGFLEDSRVASAPRRWLVPAEATVVER